MKTSHKIRIFRLLGKVQHYPWGGTQYLPALLGIPNPEHKPFAEYWMGAHERGDSEILADGHLVGTLSEIIRASPVETLGRYVSGKFGRLPFLLKILDVRDMLSIQVHPSKEMAVRGFEAETRAGVPLESGARNYKDDNHKPELVVALNEFWLLHGFRPENSLKQILQDTPELRFLLTIFEKENYTGLYHAVMKMEQAEVNRVLGPLVSRIMPGYLDGRLKKGSPDFWAARAAKTYYHPPDIDRGIFSIYLFNLIRLMPGEGIFQAAGVPHAYLEGQNVELMANSDNVLRGGLTTKHIDVGELMKHIHFRETIPEILREKGTTPDIGFFKTSAPDFELSRIHLSKNQSVALTPTSAEISFVLEGSLQVRESADHEFECRAGQAWVNFCGANCHLKALEKTTVFRATVPQT